MSLQLAELRILSGSPYPWSKRKSLFDFQLEVESLTFSSSGFDFRLGFFTRINFKHLAASTV